MITRDEAHLLAAAVTGGWDFWGNVHIDAAPRTLVRQCEDCGAAQSAQVPDESVLVPGYLNVADVEWKETV